MAQIFLATHPNEPPIKEYTMANFQMPLSGNVTQTINPMNWFNNFAGGRFGLINIDLGKSSDPALEQRILDEVGSYGRQIGQLSDALNAVLDHLDTASWSPEGRKAVRKFRNLLDDVNAVRAQHQRERRR
jgi:hypothetical protein